MTAGSLNAARVMRFSMGLLVFVAMSGAFAKDLIVFSGGAVKSALAPLAEAWEAKSGHRLQITYAAAGDLRKKLADGERADIVILPLENFAALEKDGLLRTASRRDLGAVGIGVAVKVGAKQFDISSEENFKRTLQAVKSLTYMDPTRGTSGKHFDEVVLPKLGVRDEVRAKAVLGEGGMIAEKVASGEVEFVVHQMTEMLPVKGIAILGPLPASLQKTTVYSGVVMQAAKSPMEAAALLEFLTGKDARAAFAAKGFSAP